jgi:hypothetical protein
MPSARSAETVEWLGGAAWQAPLAYRLVCQGARAAAARLSADQRAVITLNSLAQLILRQDVASSLRGHAKLCMRATFLLSHCVGCHAGKIRVGRVALEIPHNLRCRLSLASSANCARCETGVLQLERSNTGGIKAHGSRKRPANKNHGSWCVCVVAAWDIAHSLAAGGAGGNNLLAVAL